MNIYHIKWISSGSFGHCAVVIANNEIGARKLLGLEHDYATNENIRVYFIGTATETNTAEILCREVF